MTREESKKYASIWYHETRQSWAVRMFNADDRAISVAVAYRLRRQTAVRLASAWCDAVYEAWEE